MNLKKVSQLKDFFRELVEIMEKKAVYASVLYIDNKSLNISKDKDTIDVGTDSDKGIKLRAFDGNQFYEYGTSVLDRDHLIRHAERLASLCKKGNIKLDIDKKKEDKNFFSKPKIRPSSIAIRNKTEMINKLNKRLLRDKRLVNARVIYYEDNEHKIFVNKYKKLYQNVTGCFIALVPFIQAEDGSVRYHYKGYFEPGYEVHKISEAQISKQIDFAIKIGKAKRITPGKYTCIFKPDVTGLLAHESFGHGMESDTIYEGRAKAEEYLGKRIAPSNVSILENPAYPARHGSYFFDDEGQIAKPTYLVKKGIVNNPITEMFTASLGNFPRSANGRAESYDHKTYARMSNTYFDKGKATLKQMFSKVKDGMFLHYSSGGMEDPKGWGVQIQGVVAERIKDHKLTGELFFEIGLTGYLPDLLSNIQMVGNKLEIPGAGRCGKGHKEWVRVAEGGPYMLVKGVSLT